ncbi:MAG: nucleotidyl transferase AbiEii/AbiGii toxin family protein [Elusimicrobiota bacterium]
MRIFGEYKDALVLIGGWTPYFLLEHSASGVDSAESGFGARPFRHVGSIDIDLAVNPDRITGEEYSTIVQLLRDRDYDPDLEIRFRLNRTLPGMATPIGVDFLTSKPPKGDGRGRRHRKVQADLDARATEHLEIAFALNERYALEGELPEGGGLTRTEFNLASLPAIFALKGLAMGYFGRYKEKDAYDVYALARYYGRGIEDVVAELKPHLGREALRISLGHIRESFKSIAHTGPKQVAKFIEATPEEEQGIVQDAFLSVDSVLRGCRF